jgi:hypothetical protein
MKAVILKTAAWAVTAVLGVAAVFALSNTYSSRVVAEGDVQNIQTQTFSGEVTKIDGRRLTVQTENDGTKEVNIPDNVQIKKNTNDAKFEDIAVNDKVTVTQNNDGNVISLTVTPGNVDEVMKWGIPIGIGVIVLLLLLLMLLRRRKSGFIKTSVEKVQ